MIICIARRLNSPRMLSQLMRLLGSRGGRDAQPAQLLGQGSLATPCTAAIEGQGSGGPMMVDTLRVGMLVLRMVPQVTMAPMLLVDECNGSPRGGSY